MLLEAVSQDMERGEDSSRGELEKQDLNEMQPEAASQDVERGEE